MVQRAPSILKIYGLCSIKLEGQKGMGYLSISHYLWGMRYRNRILSTSNSQRITRQKNQDIFNISPIKWRLILDSSKNQKKTGTLPKTTKITRSERLLCGPGAGDLRKASFHPQGILIGRRLVAAQRLQTWSCDVLWSPNMACEGKKNGSTSMKIQSNAVQELYFYGFPGAFNDFTSSVRSLAHGATGLGLRLRAQRSAFLGTPPKPSYFATFYIN